MARKNKKVAKQVGKRRKKKQKKQSRAIVLVPSLGRTAAKATEVFQQLENLLQRNIQLNKRAEQFVLETRALLT